MSSKLWPQTLRSLATVAFIAALALWSCGCHDDDDDSVTIIVPVDKLAAVEDLSCAQLGFTDGILVTWTLPNTEPGPESIVGEDSSGHDVILENRRQLGPILRLDQRFDGARRKLCESFIRGREDRQGPIA